MLTQANFFTTTLNCRRLKELMNIRKWEMDSKGPFGVAFENPKESYETKRLLLNVFR